MLPPLFILSCINYISPLLSLPYLSLPYRYGLTRVALNSPLFLSFLQSCGPPLLPASFAHFAQFLRSFFRSSLYHTPVLPWQAAFPLNSRVLIFNTDTSIIGPSALFLTPVLAFLDAICLQSRPSRPAPVFGVSILRLFSSCHALSPFSHMCFNHPGHRSSIVVAIAPGRVDSHILMLPSSVVS